MNRLTRLLARVALSMVAVVVPANATEPNRAAVEVALGKGLTVRAPDGIADLNVRLRLQVQGLYQASPGAADRSAEPETSFFVRRFRLLFQGHVLRKALRYYVQLGMATPDMEPDLLVPVRDAWVEWQQLRDLHVRVGQGKVPFSRERIVSSSALSLVDRSNVNAELNLDRDVGVSILSPDFLGSGERLRYAIGVFGGDGRNRRATRAGLLWAARFEVLPLGPFDDLVQGDFVRSRHPKIALGTAFAYNDNTVRSQSTIGTTAEGGSLDYRHAAADVLLRWRGASVFSELIHRNGNAQADLPSDTLPQPRSGWGWLVQAGMFVHPQLEVVARVAESRMQVPERIVDREIGGGLSWYVHKHDLKVQLDYFRLLRHEEATDRTVDRVRLQTQLFF